MKTKPESWYSQSAAVPVRRAGGKLEVLLVTSLGSGRWIFPKGVIEQDMSAFDSAAKEAWEEAGVRGNIHTRPVGWYEIEKWGGACRVEAFLLEVEEFEPSWPEAGKRKRKWFGISEAKAEIHPAGAAQILEALENSGLSLTLVRHAKSSRDDPGVSDFLRPLNDRGRKDAPDMGKRLRKAGLSPDLIISSPAERALTTARLIARELAYPEEAIGEKDGIYDATGSELLEVVRRMPKKSRDILLVGHNPGISDLAGYCIGPEIENVPTCGVVRLAFDAVSWNDISPDNARLLLLDYPKKET